MRKIPPDRTTLSVSIEATDEWLIERARREPAAFAELYDRYLPCVHRYIFTRVGARDEAEDLTSQVFLAALETFPRYQHNGYFKTWLVSIARRKVADHYRHRPPEVALDRVSGLASSYPQPLAQAVHSEDLRCLSRIIEQLDEEERELLRLRFAAQLSYPEIGRLLNRKQSAVKMAVYRLLERLEAQMEVEDGI